LTKHARRGTEAGSIERLAELATTPERLPEEGRIPFRVRIGVTGHRDLEENEPLVDVLRGRIRAIQDELPLAGEEWRVAARHPLVRLAVVSQLAKGADRLVVREVFQEAIARGQEARLEVILPMSREAYADKQEFSAESKHEFKALLELAAWKYEPKHGDGPRDDRPYEAAGRQMLARCDVLIALWDGEPSGGPGGTAETLLEAAWHGRPCVWIQTPDGSNVYDNFTTDSLSGQDFYDAVESAAGLVRPKVGPGEPAFEDERVHRERLATDLRRPLQESFRRLDRFNGEHLSAGFERHVAQELKPEDVEDVSWLAASFSRATEVADRAQWRFEWFAYPILVLGPFAALLLSLNVVELFDHHPGLKTFLEWVEAVCLAAALLLFWWVRHREYHGRWLSARVLAERLRSAYHVAPTRTDFPRVATLEHVYIERSSREWVQRAVEEVWDRRPRVADSDGSLDAADLERVKRFVVRWLDGQIAYHWRKAQGHGRRDALWTPLVVILFWGGAASAGARLAHLSDTLEDISIVLTIMLPAIGAALGAWLTVAQHRALHARHEVLQADLADVLHEIRGADAHRLGPASRDAARIISGEGGDWFGTMWFLDVEHP
jgi:SMODS and SLOG-associating 2TM effector domain 1